MRFTACLMWSWSWWAGCSWIASDRRALCSGLHLFVSPELRSPLSVPVSPDGCRPAAVWHWRGDIHISTLAAIAQYFTGRNLALAMFQPRHQPRGIVLRRHVALLVRAGLRAGVAAAADHRGVVLSNLFRRGSRLLVDRPRGPRQYSAVEPAASQRFAFRDLLRFGTGYWFLLVLCVLRYAVILAFRSTFSIKYFQHATASVSLRPGQ